MTSTTTETTEPTGSRRARWASALTGHRPARFVPFAVLVLLILLISARDSSFLSIRSLRVLGEEASPLLLLAAGQTMVILVGGIDLSSATLASFGTVLLGLWLPHLGPGALVGMLVVTTAAGFVNGALSAYAQVPSFIITLGTFGAWSGIALTVSGANTTSISKGYGAIGWSAARLGALPIAVVLALAVALVLAAGMRMLSSGRSMHAVGLAEKAFIMSGRRAARVKVLAFTISGLLAGVAAMLLAARQFSGGPTLADSLQLPNIAAVVVGGTAITGGSGGLGRTIIGTLIITVLRVGLGLIGVDPSYEQIVYGALVIGAVVLTIDRSKIGVVK